MQCNVNLHAFSCRDLVVLLISITVYFELFVLKCRKVRSLDLETLRYLSSRSSLLRHCSISISSD